MNNAIKSVASGAIQEIFTGSFCLKPCAGIDRQQYRAAKRRDRIHAGAEYTIEVAGNLSDNEVFSRQEFVSAGYSCLHDLWRDGANRKAARMATSMYSTSRHQLHRLNNGALVLQSQVGAIMTKVNTHPTPALGNPSHLARQQAIENALSMALYHARHGDIQSATGRAIRAASMLKQACAEIQNGRAA